MQLTTLQRIVSLFSHPAVSVVVLPQIVLESSDPIAVVRVACAGPITSASACMCPDAYRTELTITETTNVKKFYRQFSQLVFVMADLD
jgi:hypothetical protein